MSNAEQQQPPQSGLAGFTTVAVWLERHAGPFFETKSSFDWFVKRHRRELIEAGALIPRQGRSGSLVQPEKLGHTVIVIFRRRALEKAAPTSVAASL